MHRRVVFGDTLDLNPFTLTKVDSKGVMDSGYNTTCPDNILDMIFDEGFLTLWTEHFVLLVTDLKGGTVKTTDCFSGTT